MNDTSNPTSTAVSNRRRSQRVYLQVRVVARFLLLASEWTAEGETIVVNAHGGTVRIPVAPLAAGDIITLTNPATAQVETCRVVRVEAAPSQNEAPAKSTSAAGFIVAFAFDRPSPGFWAIDFPPTDWIESLTDD